MAGRARTGPFMVFIKADCRMRPLSDFYSTLIGSRNGLPSASRRQRLLKLPHEEADGDGGLLQGYAGELPTWQKACGLITHGSQGAKNKHDQEANTERERKKVTG